MQPKKASAKEGEGAGRGPCGLRNSELGPLLHKRFIFFDKKFNIFYICGRKTDPSRFFMLDFLANYWPFIVAFVLIFLGVFAFRGVRKALKEGGGAFSLETIKKNTEPNFAALKQKSRALLADADMICEVKEGSHLVPRKKTSSSSAAPCLRSTSSPCSWCPAPTRSPTSSARPNRVCVAVSTTW